MLGEQNIVKKKANFDRKGTKIEVFQFLRANGANISRSVGLKHALVAFSIFIG